MSYRRERAGAAADEGWEVEVGGGRVVVEVAKVRVLDFQIFNGH